MDSPQPGTSRHQGTYSLLQGFIFAASTVLWCSQVTHCCLILNAFSIYKPSYGSLCSLMVCLSASHLKTPKNLFNAVGLSYCSFNSFKMFPSVSLLFYVQCLFDTQVFLCLLCSLMVCLSASHLKTSRNSFTAGGLSYCSFNSYIKAPKSFISH